jgi:2-amino-4-hydroxy-6-hydroxymethyldihydropteridine diphosphokinase
VTSVLSLGSNQGDRMAHLRLGVTVLEPVAVSRVFETEPWGELDQPPFLNLVALCAWDAEEAWRRAVEAERRAGRVRREKWGPRTLDVDVIQATGSAAGLALPHPRAHERGFVLVPWLDADPDAVLDGHGRVAEIDVDASGVRPVGALT